MRAGEVFGIPSFMLPYDAYYILFVCLGLSFRLPFSTFIYFLLILPIKKVSNSSGTIAV